jgi:predicted DCC family thiol-disulfide oxidoreductase YuxK
MIVVFDADCLLCSAWVQFLLRQDGQEAIRFASMQSSAGQDLLLSAGLNPENLETLLVVHRGRHYQNTAAIFRILHELGWPWRCAWIAWLLPAFVRDPLYRLIARHRYQWFGRKQQCIIPSQASAHRFLD